MLRTGPCGLPAGRIRLPTTTSVTLGDGSITGGVLDLNNQDQTLAGLVDAGGTSAAVSRVVDSTADATNPTLTVNNAADMMFAGVLGNVGQNGFNFARWCGNIYSGRCEHLHRNNRG